jgi:hypothetical protein
MDSLMIPFNLRISPADKSTPLVILDASNPIATLARLIDPAMLFHYFCKSKDRRNLGNRF